MNEVEYERQQEQAWLGQTMKPDEVCTIEVCGQTCEEEGGHFLFDGGDVSHGDYTEAVVTDCPCEHHK